MKVWVLFAVLIFGCNCYSQTSSYIVTVKSKNDYAGKTDTIKDKNDISFIIDSSRRYVYAMDKDGKELWKTDIWKHQIFQYTDSMTLASGPLFRQSLSEYSFIAQIFLFDDKQHFHKEIVYFVTGDNWFGEIEKETGKFIILGKD